MKNKENWFLSDLEKAELSQFTSDEILFLHKIVEAPTPTDAYKLAFPSNRAPRNMAYRMMQKKHVRDAVEVIKRAQIEAIDVNNLSTTFLKVFEDNYQKTKWLRKKRYGVVVEETEIDLTPIAVSALEKLARLKEQQELKLSQNNVQVNVVVDKQLFDAGNKG